VTSIFGRYESYLKLGENPDFGICDLQVLTGKSVSDSIPRSSNDAISKTFPGKLTGILLSSIQTIFKEILEKVDLSALRIDLKITVGKLKRNAPFSLPAFWSLPAEFSDGLESK